MLIRCILCAVMFAVVTLSGGCATIFTGTTKEITFRSTPENAQVHINGASRGETPLTLSLERKGKYVVSMTHVGYQTQTASMRKGIAPWFWGNILLGGIVGMVIDGVSGAIHEPKPTELTMTLVPLRQGQRAAPPAQVALTPEEELTQLEQLYGNGSVEEKDYQSQKKKLEKKIARSSG